MRDPKRIPIVLEALQRLWESAPDLRFGQVISVLVDRIEHNKRDPFNIEDDVWIDVIKNQVNFNYVGGKEDFPFKR